MISQLDDSLFTPSLPTLDAMNVVAMVIQIDGPSHCSDGATDDQVLGVFFDYDVLAAQVIGDHIIGNGVNNRRKLFRSHVYHSTSRPRTIY